jgi:hypothetical protein
VDFSAYVIILHRLFWFFSVVSGNSLRGVAADLDFAEKLLPAARIAKGLLYEVALV